MARLHKTFRHPNRRVVSVTRALVQAKPWSMDAQRQRRVAQRWVDYAAEQYGMNDVPQVVFGTTPVPGALGQYDPHYNRIHLDHFSVITLLHEFRHALQDAGLVLGRVPNVPVNHADWCARETDAHAWACSVFHKAAPRRFRRMVMAGRVRDVYPHDVLPASERREADAVFSEIEAGLPELSPEAEAEVAAELAAEARMEAQAHTQ